MTVGVVSEGSPSSPTASRIGSGLDHAEANELEVGTAYSPGNWSAGIVDRRRKARGAARTGGRSTVSRSSSRWRSGDGANDLDLLAAAGLGIAFNAKPVVRDAADTPLNVPYLDAALFLLGIPREDISGTDDS
jgi:phosphoserine phosphatase